MSSTLKCFWWKVTSTNVDQGGVVRERVAG